MRWLDRLRLRRSVNDDLAEEIESHLEERIESLVSEGLPLEQARRQARREFGSTALSAERGRDVWRMPVLGDAWSDLKYAARQIHRAPGFASAVVVTLAIGIGATASMYSAIDAAFFRPLPFAAPDRLVQVWLEVPFDVGTARPVSSAGSAAASGSSSSGISTPVVSRTAPGARSAADIRDLFEMRDVFSHVAAYATGGLNLGTEIEPLRISGTYVTAEFFATLGRGPLIGRTFTEGDASIGASPVLLLSHRLWHSHFGADPAMVGRSVAVNGAPHEVVGVMPEAFRFPSEAQLWIPLPVPAPISVTTAFRNSILSVLVARLAPGVTAAQARDRVAVVRQSYRGDRPPLPADDLVNPLRATLIYGREAGLRLLMASASLVLLLACVNISGLLLSRAAARRREFAMRLALGATRGRLVRQMLVESVVLALAGATLGLVIAGAGLAMLPSLGPPSLEGVSPPRLDLRVLSVTLFIATLAGVLAGVSPGLVSSRTAPGGALKIGAASASHGRRLARGFVIAQAGLASVLLVGTGLMLASLQALLSADIGMDIERIATARLNLPPSRYYSTAELAAFAQQAVARLAEAPGVAHAAAINTLPFAREGGISLAVRPEGSEPARGEPVRSPFLAVSPGYFQTMGIPLVRGRDLSWSDTRNDLAVINTSLADALWPGEDALGKRFILPAVEPRTVVGIVGNAHFWDATSAPGPQAYLPIQEFGQAYMSIVARASSGIDPESLVPHIRTAVAAVDSTIPLYAVNSMRAVVSSAAEAPRTRTGLVTGFGLIALGLAAIGVYGLLAYTVAQRTREIGLRMALGARTRQVVWMVVGQGVALTGIGVVIGLAAAAALARLVESLLFEVEARDPATYGAAALALLTATVLAALIPARRASRVDPMAALRSE